MPYSLPVSGGVTLPRRLHCIAHWWKVEFFSVVDFLWVFQVFYCHGYMWSPKLDSPSSSTLILAQGHCKPKVFLNSPGMNCHMHCLMLLLSIYAASNPTQTCAGLPWQ